MRSPSPRRRAAPWPAALLALALLGLAPGPAGSAPLPLADAHVHMEGIAFNPQTVSILVGESIEWDNHDFVPHTVTADDGSFDSGTINNGGKYTRTFAAAGTIPYHCDFHPSMTGTIVVSDPNALPDLVVSGFDFVDRVPLVERQVNVTVRNLGNAAAGHSHTAVSYAYQGGEVAIGEIEVPVLGPGASFTGNVKWTIAGKVGDFQVLARADADGEVPESAEDNNLGTAVSSVLVAGVPGLDLLDPVAG